jgi:hypothetical protein
MQLFATTHQPNVDPAPNTGSQLTHRELGLLLGTLDRVIKFHLVAEQEPELKIIRSKIEAQTISS